MFDLEFLFSFADDMYVPKVNCLLPELIKDIEKSLEAITKWLRDTGLIINQSKTFLCIFYKRETAHITLKMGDERIK
jgi:hypothetical protein